MKNAPATRDDLMRRLDELGIETSTVEHPALFTVEQSKELRGEIPGAHSKNLFLKCKKGTLWLITALESTQINLKRMHVLLGSGRLSFGKPDLLMEALGVEPGSVTPFSLINDREKQVNFILDSALMEHELLNFHPLENTATTSISREGLLAFIAGCGHEHQVLDVGSDPDTQNSPA